MDNVVALIGMSFTNEAVGLLFCLRWGLGGVISTYAYRLDSISGNCNALNLRQVNAAMLCSFTIPTQEGT
jgi:hypothetical protein